MDISNFWWQQTGGGPLPPEFIANSLRFRSSPYLNGNFSGTAYTLSFWLKRGYIGNLNYIWSSGSAGLAFGADSTMYYYSGSTIYSSPRLFRDIAAWYHVVVSQTGTGTDEGSIYVNNELLRNFTGVALTSTSGQFNIGRYYNGTYHLDGYLADFHAIDGQALAPTEFGEYNNGVWAPKRYAGTYGTTGFRLTFDPTQDADPAVGIGKDSSGNGNDFTSSGFVTSDPLTKLYDPSFDSPTRNEALWVNRIDPFQNTGFNINFNWPTNANAEAAGDGTSSFAGSDRTTFQIPPTGKYTLGFMLYNGANAGGFAYANGFSTPEDFYTGPGNINQKTGRHYYYGNALLLLAMVCIAQERF